MKFKCFCGQEFEAEPHALYTHINCPICNAELRVPSFKTTQKIPTFQMIELAFIPESFQNASRA